MISDPAQNEGPAVQPRIRMITSNIADRSAGQGLYMDGHGFPHMAYSPEMAFPGLDNSGLCRYERDPLASATC